MHFDNLFAAREKMSTLGNVQQTNDDDNNNNNNNVCDGQQQSVAEEQQLLAVETVNIEPMKVSAEQEMMTHNYEYVCNIRMLQGGAADGAAVICAEAKEEGNRLVVAFGIVVRLVLPLANGVARGIKGIRGVRLLQALQKIASSRKALTSVLAFVANSISLGLSSVQVSHRLALLLKVMKIRKSPQGLESLPDIHNNSLSTSPTLSYSRLKRDLNGRPLPLRPPTPERLAPKCCWLNVLTAPPPGSAIRADVVFIHGLHGSQLNTWKQGLWQKERRPEEFDRPPKLPLRPPKRPRHSRSTGLRPPHKRKRPRLHQTPQSSCERVDDNDFNEYPIRHRSSEHTDLQDNEFSFSTFRRRMNDSSLLLQAEFNSLLSDSAPANVTPSNNEPPAETPLKPATKEPNYTQCWPSDWLPLDCPGVRIIAVNYSTDPYLWRPLWKKKEPRTNLVERAREMTELLIAERVGHGRPIIWVGHSKGGLYIKQIIVDAWESGRPATLPLWRSSRGVFFYSVPHRGSHLASIKAPLVSRSVELIDIEKNCKYLIDLHRRFVCLYQLGHLKIEVFSFVETALTLMAVLYLRIVGVDSADPGIGDVCGIHLDHREICKPRSRECILYTELVKMINKLC